MDIEKLKREFLVDEDVLSERLGQLIEILLPYCLVGKSGSVELKRSNSSGKEQVKLVLSARMVASKIEGSSVNAEVTAEEIAAYTGLPKDQVSARAKECVDEGFAERTNRGSYKARQFKIEAFVSSLSEGNSPKRGNK